MSAGTLAGTGGLGVPGEGAGVGWGAVPPPALALLLQHGHGLVLSSRANSPIASLCSHPVPSRLPGLSLLGHECWPGGSRVPKETQIPWEAPRLCQPTQEQALPAPRT